MTIISWILFALKIKEVAIMAKRKIIGVILVIAFCIGFSTQAVNADSEQPSSWAVDQVNAAIAANLVPHSLQSRYTQAITRAEFCALAVTLFESIRSEITGRKMFSDSADRNVAKMAYIGVVSGIGNNLFAPHMNLTREEAAVMLVRLANAVGNPLPTQAAAFADNGSISSWAIESVGQIQAAGVMGGMGDNMFAPRQPYTIEQSIITILRLYNILSPVVVELRDQGITDRWLAEMVASEEIPANVTRLYLGGNSITDVTPLRNLTDLTALDLWGNNVSDLSPLSNLINLTELSLWSNDFEDITPLGNLTNLTRFNLGDNLQFNGDLSVLRNFVKLADLGLGDTWHNRMDFAPLEALVSLERLQLWGASQLSGLSIIGGLTNLTNLTINAANIRDYSPLSNLTNLTWLDLQLNGIRDISVLPLDSLPNLTYLTLWGNQITDITALSGLTTLTWLNLGNNRIKDVSILSGLTSLINLFLHENQIEDASPLSNLRSLQQVDLRGNPLSESQIGGLQTALPDLWITIE